MSVRSRGRSWISDRARSYWHLSSLRVKRWRWCRPTSACACISTNQADLTKQTHCTRGGSADSLGPCNRLLFMFSPAAERRALRSVSINLGVMVKGWDTGCIKTLVRKNVHPRHQLPPSLSCGAPTAAVLLSMLYWCSRYTDSHQTGV